MIFAILAILAMHIGVNFVGYSLSGSQPAVTTALTAGITASDTVIPVSSITGFPGAGWLYIQGEAIQYTGSTATCPAPFAAEPDCFTGASRGQQQTTAISHSQTARVYNEAAGLVSGLAGFESRTSITDLGEVTSPWSSGPAVVRFLSQAATWDWPMFEGDFAFFRIIGAMFTTAITIGIFVVFGSILVGAIGSVLRAVRP